MTTPKPFTRRDLGRIFLAGAGSVLGAPLLAQAQQRVAPGPGGAPGGTGAALHYPFPATVADAGIRLAPTPACDDHDTEAQTEGPYYSPETPLRSVLTEAGTKGRKLIVQGVVLSPTCRPVAGAVLDFWHADEDGAYDNRGMRYRGHQFTDANGIYRLETIRPALYPGRTVHMHVKVQGKTTPLLTTQVYFPDQAVDNARDGIFSPKLLVALKNLSDGSQEARFDFVIG